VPGILVVCTANVCRSPATAQLLREAFGPSVPIVSAGTRARPGAPACPVSSAWVGVDPQHHRARAITPPLVRDAALVLVFTAGQRSEVLRTMPAAQRRCFTLLQAARIAQWLVHGPAPQPDGQNPLAALVAELDAARGLAPRPARAEDDDLADPHRYGQPEHHAALERSAQAVQSITRAWAWLAAISSGGAARSREC
jgi:protein-tyrosine phosphatase